MPTNSQKITELTRLVKTLVKDNIEMKKQLDKHKGIISKLLVDNLNVKFANMNKLGTILRD